MIKIPCTSCAVIFRNPLLQFLDPPLIYTGINIDQLTILKGIRFKSANIHTSKTYTFFSIVLKHNNKKKHNNYKAESLVYHPHPIKALNKFISHCYIHTWIIIIIFLLVISHLTKGFTQYLYVCAAFSIANADDDSKLLLINHI